MELLHGLGAPALPRSGHKSIDVMDLSAGALLLASPNEHSELGKSSMAQPAAGTGRDVATVGCFCASGPASARVESCPRSVYIISDRIFGMSPPPFTIGRESHEKGV
jgi:hypothetical protein